MAYIIQTSALSKCFKSHTVVDKVDLNVMKGEIYGFIGQNGAGKTTTIRMLLNLIKPSGGEVELFGEKVTSSNIHRHLRKIGAIIETPGFYLNLTGSENLDIHRIMMGIDDKSSIERTLKEVGLWDARDKKTCHYSLGMKQRLGLARSLLHDPELLILDEPCNGLDPRGMVEIRDMLTGIAKQGKTIFVSSHILAEVEKLVSRIGILHNGRLLEEINREDFQKKNEHTLKIKVSDPQKAAELLKSMLNAKDVFIKNEFVAIKNINVENNGKTTRCLVENGIDVMESTLVQASLEEYFMKITGGGSHE